MSLDKVLRRWLWLVLLLVAACAMPAHARYARPDLVKIPVDRLTKNLEDLAKKEPKDATIRFNLARAHAMAYALKTDTAEVRRGEEASGAWFGFEPTHVPFQAEPTEDEAKLAAAKKQLDQAIAVYREVLMLDPENLSAALGYAWCLDQAKDMKAVEEYRRVIELAWKTEKDLKMADLGWHSVTAEAAGYLIAKLDPKDDAKEIATLNSRIEQMKRVPRPITPVVIPLRDGLSVYELEDRSASVAFDADGTGLQKQWTWITPDAGWLVSDLPGSGKVTSALQLFGGVTFWMFWDNGYQALAALDNDGDSELSGDELIGLAIWHDRNSNGISEPGEVKPLADWGITSISCRWERDSSQPEGIPYSPEGVVFRDGTTRPTYDIVLQPR